MKYLKTTFYQGLMILFLIGFSACSKGNKSSESSDGHDHSDSTEEAGHSHDTDGHDHGDSSEGHDHGSHEGAPIEEGEASNWTPSGTGEEVIRSDFHFITGSMEDINPEVASDDSGAKVLKLNASGNPVAFVFHQSYGNIGMAVNMRAGGFQGTYKLIHHASDADNHEFVAVTGNKMTLGRIVNGTESVFDESAFEPGDDWMNLRVSAAGTHYKGYLGNETITHGHGDKMKNGYVGIMLDGTGTIEIKSIETVPLEDE